MRVVQFEAEPRLRAPSEGALLGANPEAEQLSDAARDRYLRLAALVAEERNLNASEIEEILLDSQQSVSEFSSIFNANTRYSAVFEPKARRMRVAAPAADGGPGGSFGGVLHLRGLERLRPRRRHPGLRGLPAGVGHSVVVRGSIGGRGAGLVGNARPDFVRADGPAGDTVRAAASPGGARREEAARAVRLRVSRLFRLPGL